MASNLVPNNSLLPMSVGGADYVDRVVEVLVAAFSRGALTQFFLRDPNVPDNWTSEGIPYERLKSHFGNLVPPRAEIAELAEAGGWAGVAIW